MQYFSLTDTATYPIRKVLAFLNEISAEKLADNLGEREIEGRDFFVNVFEYQTDTKEKRIWEAHRKYIDIHLVLRGREKVAFTDVSLCNCGEYNAERDFLSIEPPAENLQKFALAAEKSSLIVFNPEDAHQTGLIAEKSEKILKAVFKLKVP
ncbi:MAG: YhcH/YjgK/YiaL family protein [Cardiobacteriaceae bacterium]|nr:YhcH/YjgK/YiaL family protein [Cardiobacteriaceae bacterium]